jgi:hypothetical protein
MKKILFLLMFVFLSVSVFAKEDWEGSRQIAITMNPNSLVTGLILGGFGINAGVEFAPIRWVSVKANIYYIGFDPFKLIGEPLFDDVDGEEIFNPIGFNVSLFRANLEGRWYPLGGYVSGWFLNGGLQFHRISASTSFSVSEANLGKGKVGIDIDTWGICVGGGYKAVIGKNRAGFVLEPMLDFTWPLRSDIPLNEMGIEGNLLGWMLGVKGLRGSLMFGVAF